MSLGKERFVESTCRSCGSLTSMNASCSCKCHHLNEIRPLLIKLIVLCYNFSLTLIEWFAFHYSWLASSSVIIFKLNYTANPNLWICFIPRAGKPPPGLHLDVMKEGKMIQVSVDLIFCQLSCAKIRESVFKHGGGSRMQPISLLFHAEHVCFWHEAFFNVYVPSLQQASALSVSACVCCLSSSSNC